MGRQDTTRTKLALLIALFKALPMKSSTSISKGNTWSVNRRALTYDMNELAISAYHLGNQILVESFVSDAMSLHFKNAAELMPFQCLFGVGSIGTGSQFGGGCQSMATNRLLVSTCGPYLR